MELLKLVLLLTIFISQSYQFEPCLVYKKQQCLRCAHNYILYQGKCHLVITIQKPQSNYFDSECRQNNCFVPTFPFPNKETKMTLSHLTHDRLNNQIFQKISIEQAKNQLSFRKCNDFIQKNRYRQFITKSSSPWKTVSISFGSNAFIYQITYWTLDGGLLQCLISYSEFSKKVELNEVVQINPQKMINNCVEYASQQYCQRCDDNFHLQFGNCFADINGCQEYYGSICLKCVEWSVLVENRCLLQCSSLSDLNHKQFHGHAICV